MGRIVHHSLLGWLGSLDWKRSIESLRLGTDGADIQALLYVIPDET